MNQYLFAVHSSAGADCQSRPPEEMQEQFQRIEALEREMRAAGALTASGRLSGADSATVVRGATDAGGDVLTTDGPFVEAKEHLAGFYIVAAADLDAALGWAKRVTEAVGQPIEVRPFMGFEAG
ncbi:MAG: YciI family protein [Planctomycetota bacterium]